MNKITHKINVGDRFRCLYSILKLKVLKYDLFSDIKYILLQMGGVFPRKRQIFTYINIDVVPSSILLYSYLTDFFFLQ